MIKIEVKRECVCEISGEEEQKIRDFIKENQEKYEFTPSDEIMREAISELGINLDNKDYAISDDSSVDINDIIWIQTLESSVEKEE